MKNDHTSFSDWHDSKTQENNAPAKLIKEAYAMLKKAVADPLQYDKPFDQLLARIPDTSFEYHELVFLWTHRVTSYQQFQREKCANSYSRAMLPVIESMIRYCPAERKSFFQNLYASYEKDLKDFEHDCRIMAQVREFYSKQQWKGCGMLLEQEIANGSDNLAWYIYMAKVKLAIDPSYDCKEEYQCFEKHFDTASVRKKYNGDYYNYFNPIDEFSEYNDVTRTRTRFHIGDDPTDELLAKSMVTNLIDSRLNYSKRFSSLFLLPFNFFVGYLLGLRIIVIGMGLVPLVALGAEVYHIYQLFTLSKRKLFKKVLVKEKRIVFAQLAYYELERYFLRNWDYIPWELLGF